MVGGGTSHGSLQQSSSHSQHRPSHTGINHSSHPPAGHGQHHNSHPPAGHGQHHNSHLHNFHNPQPHTGGHSPMPMNPYHLNMKAAPVFHSTHAAKRAHFWRVEHLDQLSTQGRLHPSLRQLWGVKGANGLKAKSRTYRETRSIHVPQSPRGRQLVLLFLTDTMGTAVYLIRSPQGWTLPGGTVDEYHDGTLFQSAKRHFAEQTNTGLPRIQQLIRHKMKKKIFNSQSVHIFFGYLDLGQPLPTTPIPK